MRRQLQYLIQSSRSLHSSQLCDGHGSCNSLTGQCLCYAGFQGSDCSVETEGSTLTSGNIVPSNTRFEKEVYDMTAEETMFLTLTNSGQSR